MPPTPSVMAWCSLMITAERSPSQPWTRAISQSGRSRSKSCSAICSAMRINGRSEPSAGTWKRLRWKVRSKLGSTSQRGGIGETGLPMTRWRSFGTASVIRVIRSTSRSTSGISSSTVIATTTERRTGSCSTPHMTASNAPIRSSLSSDIAHSSPLVVPATEAIGAGGRTRGRGRGGDVSSWRGSVGPQDGRSSSPPRDHERPRDTPVELRDPSVAHRATSSRVPQCSPAQMPGPGGTSPGPWQLWS